MAYGNTLNNLIPDLYAAMTIVAREMVGLLPSVSMDSDVGLRAAVGQNVDTLVAADVVGEDVTPGQFPPDTGGAAHDVRQMTITKYRSYPFSWTGEDEKGLRSGDNWVEFQRQRLARAVRKVVNDLEADLASLYTRASRAYGTAGTAPFATANDLTDVANMKKLLNDNGAPRGDRQLVLGSDPWVNLSGIQSSLWKVNEAGTEEFLRQGFISQGLQGFALRESAQVADHTKGTGAGYLVDLVAGYTVGDTAIHVDTGTGTILAGDVVTFTGDTNKYVVKTGFAGDGDGDIVLQEPGLRQTLANDVAMTIGASYTAHMAFNRPAIHLVTRAPQMPEGGDEAKDVFPFRDRLTGLSFELRHYGGYHAARHELTLVWGYEAMNPDFLHLLLG
jgi:hypothetical protein